MKNIIFIIGIIFISIFTSCKKGDEPIPSSTYVIEILPDNSGVSGTLVSVQIKTDGYAYYNGTKYEVCSPYKDDIMKGNFIYDLWVKNPNYNPNNSDSVEKYYGYKY